MMVDPVGSSGVGRLDRSRTLPPEKVGNGDRKVTPGDGHGTPAARFARLGPPIDVTRVAEIKAALAEGSYTVDADRLAAAMLALDLPAKKA
jgi:negative regulator of flagellin synthesis FlgM